MKLHKIKKAMIVYQAGIANVFQVTAFNLSDYGRDAKRLLQYDFHSCEVYAKGLHDAGVTVRVAGCNMAGDITNQHWTTDMDSLPFSDSHRYPKAWLK